MNSLFDPLGQLASQGSKMSIQSQEESQPLRMSDLGSGGNQVKTVPNFFDVVAIGTLSAAACSIGQRFIPYTGTMPTFHGLSGSATLALQTGASSLVAETANWSVNGTAGSYLPESIRETPIATNTYLMPVATGVSQIALNSRFSPYSFEGESVAVSFARGASADLAARSAYNYFTGQNL